MLERLGMPELSHGYRLFFKARLGLRLSGRRWQGSAVRSAAVSNERHHSKKHCRLPGGSMALAGGNGASFTSASRRALSCTAPSLAIELHRSIQTPQRLMCLSCTHISASFGPCPQM